MSIIKILKLLPFVGLSFLVVPQQSYADARDREFGYQRVLRVHHAISSDGSHGTWSGWRGELDDRPIKQVSASLLRQRGTRETTCSLSIEGQAPLAPNPMQIDQNYLHVVTWNLNGPLWSGRSMDLNCTGGVVYVESLTVTYGSSRNVVEGSYGNSRDRLPSGQQRRIEDLGEELEDLTNEAYDALRENRRWSDNRGLLNSVKKFRDRVGDFNRRVAQSDVRGWELNRQAEDLRKDAQNVQKLIRRSGIAEKNSYDDWRSIENVLRDIIDASR